mgnify:FL=1
MQKQQRDGIECRPTRSLANFSALLREECVGDLGDQISKNSRKIRPPSVRHGHESGSLRSLLYGLAAVGIVSALKAATSGGKRNGLLETAARCQPHWPQCPVQGFVSRTG